jgi:hypothetical protein
LGVLGRRRVPMRDAPINMPGIAIGASGAPASL